LNVRESSIGTTTTTSSWIREDNQEVRLWEHT